MQDPRMVEIGRKLYDRILDWRPNKPLLEGPAPLSHPELIREGWRMALVLLSMGSPLDEEKILEEFFRDINEMHYPVNWEQHHAALCGELSALIGG